MATDNLNTDSTLVTLPHQGCSTAHALPVRRVAAADFLALGIVLLVTVGVLGKDIAVGGPRHGDSAVHAMDGVLIHDWVRAGAKAWVSPISFAEAQYAHYPSLGIGRHYPPGFAVVEAGFFAVFGISIFSARLCVLFFGLIAAVGTYTFMRSLRTIPVEPGRPSRSGETTKQKVEPVGGPPMAASSPGQATGPPDRATSALAAIILITMPAMTLWGRQTKLEVPVLAVLIWGAVAFIWYLRRTSWGRLAVLLSVALLALAFRQTGVFLLGAISLTLTVCALWRTVRWAHCLCAIAVSVTALGLLVLSLDTHGAQLTFGEGGAASTDPSPWGFLANLGPLTFYMTCIPGQVGIMVLLAAGIGLAGAIRKAVGGPRRARVPSRMGAPSFAAYVFSGFTVDSEPGARATGTPNHPALALGARKQPADRETSPRNTPNTYFAAGEGRGKDKIAKPSPNVSVPHPCFARMGHPRDYLHVQCLFLSCWVLTSYLMLSLGSYKNPRFFVVGLFPFAVWAALGASRLMDVLPGKRVRLAACALVGAVLGTVALSRPVEHRPDYGNVVLASRDRIESRPVLFSGVRDGDFVLALRQHIPWRRALVIRASKLLYTCSAYPDRDFVSHVGSPEELAELMERFAFEYVFVERENKLGVAQDALLRDYLARAGMYRRIASHSLRSDPIPSYRDVTIDVYEALEPRPRTVKYFDIPLPRVGRMIRVDLEDWADS